jgi:hypothetical protein
VIAFLPKSTEEMMEGKNMPIYVGLAGMLGILSFTFLWNITRSKTLIQPTLGDFEGKEEAPKGYIELE